MTYKFLEIERKGRLCWVRMNRGMFNDLTVEFMGELIHVHKQLENDNDIWGVLLGSASEHFFCNGMNPESMLEYSVEQRCRVFNKLIEMIEVIYGFSKPELAVINGHAMAGGAFLGLLTDSRFMAKGKAKYCFSEVKVGLTIPPVFLELMKTVIGHSNLTQAAMLARIYNPEEAQAIGLVDQVFAPEKLSQKSEEYMENLFKLPQASIQHVKSSIRAPYLEMLNAHVKSNQDDFSAFLTGNFEEGLRAVMARRAPVFTNP